jgi:hypothetical protein
MLARSSGRANRRNTMHTLLYAAPSLFVGDGSVFAQGAGGTCPLTHDAARLVARSNAPQEASAKKWKGPVTTAALS